MHPQFTASDIERFWAKVNKKDSCWLWTGTITRDGYGYFYAGGRDNFHGYRAHRVAYQLANGEIPDGVLICHNCPGGDNRLCVNPSHLWTGDAQANNTDALNKGRTARGDRSPSRLNPESRPRGEAHPAAKLTADQVREIRRRYVPRVVSYGALGHEFGVDRTVIYNIIRRKIWAHLP